MNWNKFLMIYGVYIGVNFLLTRMDVEKIIRYEIKYTAEKKM